MVVAAVAVVVGKKTRRDRLVNTAATRVIFPTLGDLVEWHWPWG